MPDVAIDAWCECRCREERTSDVQTNVGPYLRLIDFVYHSTLGLRVIKKKKNREALEKRVGPLQGYLAHKKEPPPGTL